MARLVSVWLENWPIRRFLAAQRNGRLPLGCAPVDVDAPFALTAESSGGPQIVAVNAGAAAASIVPGDRLADALAKAGPIQIRASDPKADRRALRRLALWATRYAPAVTPFDGRSGEDGIFLDITGAIHLFGGEQPLLADLGDRLAGFGLPARLAVADTAGAGWALAHFGAGRLTILPSGGEAATLKSLPVEALRLEDQARAALRVLGFRRIGDLLDQPRAPFAKRLGAGLLTALDQALGRAPEPLAALAPPPVYEAIRPMTEPLFTQESIVAVAADLMADLAPGLIGDGVGARRLRLGLYRVDGRALFIPIGLARPGRDPAHLARLVALRLERLGEGLDAGFGFEAIRLDVVEAEPMTERQARLGSDKPRAEAERFGAVIDILHQRLGGASLTRPHPVESHLPERACLRRPFDEGQPRHPADRRGPRLRPPLMLRQAEPTDVVALVPEGPPRRFRWRGVLHRVRRADGPERIAPEWWRRREPQSARDYYVVEDEAGRRFWLFREGLYGRETADPRWFMQGLFG